jgi:hypothetical protein
MSSNTAGRLFVCALCALIAAPNFAAAQSPPLRPGQSPFEGLWAKTKKECLDEDGPNSRTLIDLTNVVDGKPTPIFDQYENHCLIDRKSAAGDKMSLNVTCFEFWDNFTQRVDGEKRTIKLSQGRNGRLVIDGEAYARCETKRPSSAMH